MKEGGEGVTQARHESDQPAATGVDASRTVERDDARGPARLKAKNRDDSAGKRGRQMNARLVRMHGGLVIEGGR
ncbi:hypothetical protein LNAOJCKE_0923 [Methylorubrum aminovorans]|uniref:Uncharacterized protein n=1 Tax=Methylorubrum aminovorans TaxID=269069 RepID=A0ABQ4UD64_9HYPH|nr:hypothetical protein LNAOJCKE_0923 [Methylorubrum aminovorans]GMA79840.1 hypothetical protein GCM10025880_62570 [Methylorubrum aminovorans]